MKIKRHNKDYKQSVKKERGTFSVSIIAQTEKLE